MKSLTTHSVVAFLAALMGLLASGPLVPVCEVCPEPVVCPEVVPEAPPEVVAPEIVPAIEPLPAAE